MDKMIIHKELRPWGNYEGLCDNEVSTVKIMTLYPTSRLSVQVHKFRDQLYYMLADGLEVCWLPEYSFGFKILEHQKDKTRVLNDCNKLWNEDSKMIRSRRGDMFFFPRGMFHSCCNRSDDSIKFLDIAFGENDEEDIFRILDRYGRV